MCLPVFWIYELFGIDVILQVKKRQIRKILNNKIIHTYNKDNDFYLYGNSLTISTVFFNAYFTIKLYNNIVFLGNLHFGDQRK